MIVTIPLSTTMTTMVIWTVFPLTLSFNDARDADSFSLVLRSLCSLCCLLLSSHYCRDICLDTCATWDLTPTTQIAVSTRPAQRNPSTQIAWTLWGSCVSGRPWREVRETEEMLRALRSAGSASILFGRMALLYRDG
jgi:hypothetical protein